MAPVARDFLTALQPILLRRSLEFALSESSVRISPALVKCW